MDPETKDILETDLENTFANVRVTLPDDEGNHQESNYVEFRPIFRHVRQPGPTPIFLPDEMRPEVVIQYPTEDRNSVSFLAFKAPAKNGRSESWRRTDEEVVGTRTISGSTKEIIEIDPSDHGIDSIELLLDRLDPETTSRLQGIIYDSTGTKLAYKFLYNTEIVNSVDPNWTKMKFDLSWHDLSKNPLTVELSEIPDGSNPTGIGIKVNAADEGIIRAYSPTIQQAYGSIKITTMRLTIFARTKNKGLSPDKTKFVSGNRIAEGLAKVIVDHVYKNWRIGKGNSMLVDVRQTNGNPEMVDIDAVYFTAIDIDLSYAIASTEEIKPLASIEIESVNMV